MNELWYLKLFSVQSLVTGIMNNCRGGKMMCVCVCVCVRACVHACLCVRARKRACV